MVNSYKFLIYAHASNDETVSHFRKIIILYPALEKEGKELINAYNFLGKKLNKFIDYVTNNWKVR